MLTGASDSESPSNAVQFEARVLSCRECEIEWECGQKLHRPMADPSNKAANGRKVLWRLIFVMIKNKNALLILYSSTE